MILLVNANAERIPMADNSVHAVVTSPPYYGLRKYQIDGDAEIGLEDTPEQYLERMVAVFREVRRVLRDDGVAWVNMGDSYTGSKNSGGDSPRVNGGIPYKMTGLQPIMPEGYKPLDLMNIPARLVLELQRDGWYHRSTVIWVKPNPMPESVSGTRWEQHKIKIEAGKIDGMFAHQAMNDAAALGLTAQYSDCPGCAKCEPHGGLVLRHGSWRPTTAHEYIFMLTKTADYFADGEAVREVSFNSRVGSILPAYNDKIIQDIGTMNHNTRIGLMREREYPAGRNARTVWDFPTQPFSGAHFATYPEELPRRCLKASISERGCCPMCGSQWARVVEKGYRAPSQEDIIATMIAKGVPRQKANLYGNPSRAPELYAADPDKTTGWLPTCSCPPHDPVPAIVLDPFCGSGTTGIAARELGAHFVGLDLSYPYLHDQARERLGMTALDAWSKGSAKQDGKVITDLPLFGDIITS
jgi:site-specific DNA-methyltransferase (adenine-specific)